MKPRVNADIQDPVKATVTRTAGIMI